MKCSISTYYKILDAELYDFDDGYMQLNVDIDTKNIYLEEYVSMQKKSIADMCNVPEEKVLLMLDNQKTYRIFENLFVNVVKYAMPNSRVYLEVRKKASLVEIILKNMSADEIHISGDEITERFVRGDSSRNTEGSGLGLAIAKSFTEAQGGEFHVEVDGDLFKVVILF